MLSEQRSFVAENHAKMLIVFKGTHPEDEKTLLRSNAGVYFYLREEYVTTCLGVKVFLKPLAIKYLVRALLISIIILQA